MQLRTLNRKDPIGTEKAPVTMKHKFVSPRVLAAPLPFKTCLAAAIGQVAVLPFHEEHSCNKTLRKCLNNYVSLSYFEYIRTRATCCVMANKNMSKM